MSTLLLRLAGPMQSWGVQSRYVHRDTGMEPSKSGVIGLLCAAMGWPRNEDEHLGYRLKDLADLFFGVRVDREGLQEADYHTASNVIKANGSEPETVISLRYYLADADFLVGLEGKGDLLQLLDDAFLCPKWPLYLGHKSFVPGLPVRIGLVDLPLEEALCSYPWLARNPRERERMLSRIDGDFQAGRPFQLRLVLDAPFGSTNEERPDVPLSFADRLFGKRCVMTNFMLLTPEQVLPELIQEEPFHVSQPTFS